MESEAGGYGLIVILGVLVAMIAIPALIIATENSGQRMARGKYLVAFLVANIFAPIVIGIVNGVAQPQGDNVVLSLVGAIVMLVLFVWFLRSMVKRVRDAGHGKGLAYLALVPIVGFLFFIYLLFPGSAGATADA